MAMGLARLTSSTRSICSVVHSARSPLPGSPALAISTSRSPAAASSRSSWLRSARSATIARPFTSAATISTTADRRPVTTSSAPSARSATAMARPRPPLPPVTSTRAPRSSVMACDPRVNGASSGSPPRRDLYSPPPLAVVIGPSRGRAVILRCAPSPRSRPADRGGARRCRRHLAAGRGRGGPAALVDGIPLGHPAGEPGGLRHRWICHRGRPRTSGSEPLLPPPGRRRLLRRTHHLLDLCGTGRSARTGRARADGPLVRDCFTGRGPGVDLGCGGAGAGGLDRKSWLTPMELLRRRQAPHRPDRRAGPGRPSLASHRDRQTGSRQRPRRCHGLPRRRGLRQVQPHPHDAHPVTLG